jgi:hypothetical protein
MAVLILLPGDKGKTKRPISRIPVTNDEQFGHLLDWALGQI